MVARPFRFGVLSLGTASSQDWRALARRVEDLGFEVLQVPQHLSLRIAPASVALAMAAAATSRLRIGTLVVANELQHPAIVATESAWLAALTDGRFDLGIGAGWLAADDDVIGRPFAPAPVRVDRLDEAVRLIRRAWSAERLDFDGRHYQVRGLANRPLPPSPPPRLLIGGGGSACSTSPHATPTS